MNTTEQNPDTKEQLGIVIESYNHNDIHRVVVVKLPGEDKNYFFFYVSEHPRVEFGDTIEMNFYSDEYYICRGNDRLTFKLTPLVFPDTLLYELITERMNQ